MTTRAPTLAYQCHRKAHDSILAAEVAVEFLRDQAADSPHAVDLQFAIEHLGAARRIIDRLRRQQEG